MCWEIEVFFERLLIMFNITDSDIKCARLYFGKFIQSRNPKYISYRLVDPKLGLPTFRTSLRGKYNNRSNRIPEKQREDVRQRILSFPAEASHYSRAHKPKPEVTELHSFYSCYAREVR